MFKSINKSIALTKTTIKVISKDKKLFIFPILSGICSIIFFFVMIFPFFLSEIAKQIVGDTASQVLFYIALFLLYLGMAFITTFFNVCVVYIVKSRLDGGSAKATEAISSAFSRIHLIFAWSIIAATVGIIMDIIDQIAENQEAIGKLIINWINSVIGATWGIITIFVVPAMVYNNLGPLGAIKKSVQVLRKTWGESVIRYVGIGVVQMISIILAFLVGIVLFFIGAMSGNAIIFFLTLLISIMLVVGVIVFFGLVTSVFNTAIYHYADRGEVPESFDEQTIRSVIQ